MHEPPQTKPVMDITTPRAMPQVNPRPSQAAAPIHEPPQATGQESASTAPTHLDQPEPVAPKSKPTELANATPQLVSDLKPHESTTPVGAITIVVFAMLTLSALAVMIYLQTN